MNGTGTRLTATHPDSETVIATQSGRSLHAAFVQWQEHSCHMNGMPNATNQSQMSQCTVFGVQCVCDNMKA